ncbi:Carboxypeptidase regulatory-like domain protein [Candidatus Norongarragalina meridionalis]|nr:Carboxypeptidase regulatory-like domain protein [Candidatus Norongarragalina meridionalis]
MRFELPAESKWLVGIAALILIAAVFLFFAQPAAKETVKKAPVRLYNGDFLLQVMDSANGTPVAGAEISYSVGTRSGRVRTDANGSAKFEIREALPVSLRVSKQGYSPSVLTILATKGGAVVKLDREKQPETNATQLSFASKGYATIKVTDENGKLIEPGVARLFDYATSNLIGEADLSFGNAVIGGAEIGALAYVSVEADGYATYDGYADAKEISEKFTEFDVVLKTDAGNSAKTSVRAVDASGSPVSAVISVIADGGGTVAEEDTSGTLEVMLDKSEAYYAVASADGYAETRSDSFAAGDDVTITMQRESAAFQFDVNVWDEDGNPIGGASVGIFTTDGKQAAEAQSTDAYGTASFMLPQGGYEARASAGGKNASATVSLSQDDAADITLEINTGIITASATDASGGASVSASFEAMQGDEVVSSCAVTTVCALKVKIGSDAAVTATAKGYISAERTARAGDSVAIPLSKEGSALAVSMAVYGKNGKQTKTLEAGKEYRVVLSLSALSGSTEAGAALRAGTQKTVMEDFAGLSNYPRDAKAVLRSTSYAPDSTGLCTDIKQDFVEPADGLLKWAEARYDSGASRQVEFAVKVKPEAKAGGRLTLYYRGFSVRNGEYSRFPPDALLGTAADAANKAGCYAEWTSASYAITAAVASPSPSPSPSPKPSAVPQAGNATIWFDAASGTIKTNFDAITLAADAVYPMDAMPLDIADSADCTLVYSIKSAKGTEKCYSYDKTKKAFVFKARDANTQCPIKVEGDSLEDDASASLELGASCGTANKSVPIRMTAESVQSLYSAPRSLDAGDGSAKIVYILNEKQSGSRSLTPDVSFSGAGTKAIAWSGPGNLVVKEGDSVVAQWAYDQQASFFQGVGGIGGERAESCSDWLCCANAWCSKSAYAQANDAFKRKAQEIADETVFRRGNGEPLKTIGGSFTFVGVAQTVEQTIAENETRPPECVPSNPAVFEMKAKTSDGEAWDYSSSVMGVGVNLKDSSNKPELCNFLHAENATVKQTKNATLASMQQAKTVIPIVIPSFFVDFSGVKGSCGKTDTCRGKGTMMSVPGIIPYPLTAEVSCQQVELNSQADVAVSCSVNTRNTILVTPSVATVSSGTEKTFNYMCCDSSGKQMTNCPATVTWDVSPGATIPNGVFRATAEKTYAVTASSGTLLKKSASVTVTAQASPKTCVARCTPVQGDIQMIPFDNKLFVIVRFGTNEACATTLPPWYSIAMGTAEAWMFMKSMSAPDAQGSVGGSLYPTQSSPASFGQSYLTSLATSASGGMFGGVSSAIPYGYPGYSYGVQGYNGMPFQTG